MLTPVFELSQDDEFVVVIIKTPYVKVRLIIMESKSEHTAYTWEKGFSLQNLSILLALV